MYCHVHCKTEWRAYIFNKVGILSLVLTQSQSLDHLGGHRAVVRHTNPPPAFVPLVADPATVPDGARRGLARWRSTARYLIGS
jgi:hypothetical protein